LTLKVKNVVFSKTRLFSLQNESLLNCQNNSSRTSHPASKKQSKNVAGSRKQHFIQKLDRVVTTNGIKTPSQKVKSKQKQKRKQKLGMMNEKEKK
jgi:hypothetical protein